MVSATRLVTIVLALVATALPAAAQQDSDLETLASLMTGAFASTRQAAENEEFLDVRLHVTRIWTSRDDAIWLYVEQALASSLEKPYRQRIYRLSRGGGSELASAVFELPGDALSFAGAWSAPSRFDPIGPDDLVEREGCVVYLRRESEGRFSGTTRERDCKSSLRGAAYATTHVTVTKDSLTSWDRGYDADGKQVWGSTNGAYVFDRARD